MNTLLGRQPLAHKSSLDSDLSLNNINDFFRTVAISKDHQSASSYEPPVSLSDSASSSIFQFQHPSEVLMALKHLDTKKSAGPDGIPALFLQKVAEKIAVIS